MAEQVIRHDRIGQLQELRERALLQLRRAGVTLADEALEEHVELLHAPPAAPQEPLVPGVH